MSDEKLDQYNYVQSTVNRLSNILSYTYLTYDPEKTENAKTFHVILNALLDNWEKVFSK